MTYLATLLMCAILSACGGSTAFVEENVKAMDSGPAETLSMQDERFDQTYSLNLDGEVKAANINGSIKVSTWDSPQVRLVAIKSASNPENLKYVTVKVESTDALFSVKVDYGDEGRREDGNWRKVEDLKVEFELTVPRTANLSGITTVNGDVTIAGTAGRTKASTVNGAVRASNLAGAAKLSTVNGIVEADFDRLEPGSDIKATTVNGTVTVVLPSDADATIKANSLSGSITNDFGLPVRKGEFVGRDMHGQLGSGDVKIKLSSVSGNLSVGRKNDGRQVNPATNLLKMREDGDSYGENY